MKKSLEQIQDLHKLFLGLYDNFMMSPEEVTSFAIKRELSFKERIDIHDSLHKMGCIFKQLLS